MDAYNQILKKTSDNLIPFTVHWELTYKCNLHCVHCYAVNRDAGNELTFEEMGLPQNLWVKVSEKR